MVAILGYVCIPKTAFKTFSKFAIVQFPRNFKRTNDDDNYENGDDDDGDAVLQLRRTPLKTLYF